MKTPCICLLAALIPLAPAAIAKDHPGTPPPNQQKGDEKPSLALTIKLDKENKILQTTLYNNGKIPVTVFKKAPTEVLAAEFIFYIKNERGEEVYENRSRTLYELDSRTSERMPLQPGETITYSLPMENVIPQEELKQLPPGPKTLLVEYRGRGEFDWKNPPSQTITIE